MELGIGRRRWPDGQPGGVELEVERLLQVGLGAQGAGDATPDTRPGGSRQTLGSLQ